MTTFEWDESKNQENQVKHGVSFEEASQAFTDPHKLTTVDLAHSTTEEKRFFVIGEVEVTRDEEVYTAVVTVRFTYRESSIRIIGAGIWRKQRRLYYAHKEK